MNPVLYTTDAEAAAPCTSDGVHVCQCVVLQMQMFLSRCCCISHPVNVFFNVLNCLLMIAFYQFLLGACLYVRVCNNSNNNNRRTGLKKAEENVTCTTNNKKENVKTTTTNQLCTLHDNDKNKCTTTNALAWNVMECDDYLIDATLLYYGGVGLSGHCAFWRISAWISEWALRWASWPVPDTFPLHTDFHVKFHIVHVDLQSGHVDFAEWSCIDNRFWHLPKLGLVDSNRSLDQCWPVIEKWSGY